MKHLRLYAAIALLRGAGFVAGIIAGPNLATVRSERKVRGTTSKLSNPKVFSAETGDLGHHPYRTHPARLAHRSCDLLCMDLDQREGDEYRPAPGRYGRWTARIRHRSRRNRRQRIGHRARRGCRTLQRWLSRLVRVRIGFLVRHSIRVRLINRSWIASGYWRYIRVWIWLARVGHRSISLQVCQLRSSRLVPVGSKSVLKSRGRVP